MLLMEEKCIRGGICLAIYKDLLLSQNFPANNSEWIKDTSQFNKYFIKKYNNKSDERYFMRLTLNILKNYVNFVMIYHFYQAQ